MGIELPRKRLQRRASKRKSTNIPTDFSEGVEFGCDAWYCLVSSVLVSIIGLVDCSYSTHDGCIKAD
jgi:hypothetical protein